MSNDVATIKVTDKNSLNFIRILAALQVLIGHAEIHLHTIFLPNVLSRTFSALQGVPVFFILSGFLIWNSIAKTKDLKTFCKKRVFRLYPELWCGVALSFVVVTILFFDQIRWIPYLAFQVTQATFLQFWTPDFLRGYGNGTPNGSLWTICVMLQSYLVMWFLYKLLHNKGKPVWLFTNVICIVLSFTPILADNLLPSLLAKLYRQTFVPYLFLFVIGMTLCEFFKQTIPFLKKYWGLFAVATFIVVFTSFDILGTYGVLKCLFMAPAIIGFAYRYPGFSLKNDYSYGVYIYHMIVINVMIFFGITDSFWNVPVVMIFSFLLAMLSYYTAGAFSRKKRNILQ